MSSFVHRLKVQNNISTDLIVPFKFDLTFDSQEELSKIVFSGVDPEFSSKVNEGDFIVAGENFGCGPYNDFAPIAIKSIGIKAIIAKSFSRIFYRNAFNCGLYLIECETNYIDDLDEVELDVEKNLLKNLSKGFFIDIKPVHRILRTLITSGGVVNYYNEKGCFEFEK